MEQCKKLHNDLPIADVPKAFLILPLNVLICGCTFHYFLHVALIDSVWSIEENATDKSEHFSTQVRKLVLDDVHGLPHI